MRRVEAQINATQMGPAKKSWSLSLVTVFKLTPLACKQKEVNTNLSQQHWRTFCFIFKDTYILQLFAFTFAYYGTILHLLTDDNEQTIMTNMDQIYTVTSLCLQS